MSPVPLVPSPCSSPSVALATFLCVTGQEEPRCRPAPSRGHTGTPSRSSPGSGSSAGCPPLSGLPWSQGWWAPTALPAPCALSWPLTHSPAVALLRLPISMNKCVPPGPLFAASLMGALHRPGAQAAGRSRLSGTPSVGPRSPAQPPPWHVGESLGAVTGPLPGGRAYFRSALLLAVVCTGSGGAASGWSRYLSHSLGSPCSAEGWGRGHTWCNRPQAATSSRCALPCASQQEACVFTIKGSAGQCRPRRAADPARWRAGSSSCQPSHTPCRRLRLSSSVSGRGFCARAGLSNGDKFLWLFPGEWLPPFSGALGALVHFSSLGSSTPGPVLPRSSEGSAVPAMGRSAW